MTSSPANRRFTQQTARKFWYFLTPIFVLIVLWRVYQWTQGGDELWGGLPSLGMVFLGLSIIAGKERKPSYNILLTLALVCVFTGLGLLIWNWSNG